MTGYLREFTFIVIVSVRLWRYYRHRRASLSRHWATARSLAWLVIRAAHLLKPVGVAGAMIVLLMVLTATFADIVAPYSPYTLSMELQFAPPTHGRPFGSDEFGRDVLTRCLYGARPALLFGCASWLLAAAIGTILGFRIRLWSADGDTQAPTMASRIIGWGLAFLSSSYYIVVPMIVMVLAVFIPGRSIIEMILVCALTFIPLATRISCSYFFIVWENVRISNIIPINVSIWNIMKSAYISIVITKIGLVIFALELLSYYGLGISEPEPSWGLMISGGTTLYARSAPWLIFCPAGSIILAWFGFWALGNALRDIFENRE